MCVLAAPIAGSPPALDDAPALDAAAPAAPRPPPPAPPAVSAAIAAPSPTSVDEVVHRLAGIDPQASARTATETILAAWGDGSRLGEEIRLPDGLAFVAGQRSLQELQLTANRSMLRLLDLPALLVLRLDAAEAPRYVALTGMDESRVVLSVDGVSITADSDLLQRFWTGQAHILWRDFVDLGPTLSPGARGVSVAHLQELLQRVGTYDVEPTGTFDAGTARAVIDFQRTHLLDADGLVGPLTRIVLYAKGGYRRPALAIPTGAAS